MHQCDLQNFSSPLHLFVLQHLPVVLSHLFLHRCMSLRYFTYSSDWIKGMISKIRTALSSINIQKQSLEVFCKNGVLRNFTKFTGKYLYQSLFFNKVAGLRPATLLKKRLWYRCFAVNFVKFLRIPFYIEHFWWLLLNIV